MKAIIDAIVAFVVQYYWEKATETFLLSTVAFVVSETLAHAEPLSTFLMPQFSPPNLIIAIDKIFDILSWPIAINAGFSLFMLISNLIKRYIADIKNTFSS